MKLELIKVNSLFNEKQEPIKGRITRATRYKLMLYLIQSKPMYEPVIDGIKMSPPKQISNIDEIQKELFFCDLVLKKITTNPIIDSNRSRIMKNPLQVSVAI